MGKFNKRKSKAPEKSRNVKTRRKNKVALIIGFVFSALTPYVTVAYFFPRVTIYSAEPLDPASALETPFVISNDGTIMWPTDKYTVRFPLRSFSISPVSFADMAVVVQYRPLPLVPFVRERVFRFMTAKTKDGQLNWYPQPLAMQLD